MLSKPEGCKGCIGYNWFPSGKGFVPPSGSGENGVLIVAEAAGEHEADQGVGLVGKAGYFFFQNLQRAGIEREGFRVANVLSCRPPDNKLSKMPYELEVVQNCSQYLDAEICSMHKKCKETGRTFVILTLGRIAFKRIMGLDDRSPIMRGDYVCYPFWNERYQAYVIAADHPSFLMRGQTHLIPVLQFAAKRALEIAENGLRYHQPNYLRDPDPSTFAQWIRDYKHYAEAHPSENALAFDIETPYKVGRDEEEVAREDDDDYTILRCSFSYQTGLAVSVPWNSEYRALLEDLFLSDFPKVGWNSENYDLPRIKAQMRVNGDQIDAMLCWHVLNSSLPKGLGFVAPFYCLDIPVWKHTSNDDPAGYNAMDSDVTLRCFYGIKGDLVRNKQWGIYNKHVVELNRVLNYMSGKGVLLDRGMRDESEVKLAGILDQVEKGMEESVPKEARKLKIYKKIPKNLEGIEEIIQDSPFKVCEKCGELKPRKNHSKFCDGVQGSIMIPSKVWGKPLEFKVSKTGLQSYQKALRHQAILSRKEKKVTFDDQALMKLIKQYPNDKLYPLIRDHREVQKLLSTYIGITQIDGRIRGGMPIGRDGRVHTQYTHNPSTLRLASQSPNLQNLPRPGGENDLQTIIRNLIVAGEGNIFLARDYSGIEAVLVGYFANAPSYIRLAKMDVHSYYTAYALNQLDGRIKTADLPDIGWDDARLAKRLGEIKKEFKKERNELYKHLVHGANFYQGAKGAAAKIFAETGIEFPVKLVQRVMDVYFELFPDIRKWHHNLWLQAEKEGFVRNPFGYIHRFNKVFDYEKIGGRWTKKPGPDANKVVAFLPQSTAAGIIKEAILRLYFNRFEEAGRYLRLQVHDEIFTEVPEGEVDSVDRIMQEEMERPIPEMRLSASYNMGEYLSILTEAKKGKRWGGMK